eukprot:SAG22_NODE_3670_length_1584_cov_1.645118_4_plen_25_part_01
MPPPLLLPKPLPLRGNNAGRHQML